MTCPCSRSRFRRLRRFCSLICLLAGCCSLPPAKAQDLDKALQSINEDITAFAFAPDGRIVYSVRRMFRTKRYDLQRDDIWLQDTNGKRRRLLSGEKFLRGNRPFTYAVDFFRWSPNGRMILVQLFTTSVVDDAGKTEDSLMMLLLEESGKEIHIGGNDSVVKDAENAIWLRDNVTLVYLTEAVKPRTLFSFQYLNLSTGPAGKAFEGRTFLAADAIPHSNATIAIERDSNLSGPPRLQRLELLTQEDQELATLDAYAGGLSVSPSGKKVAYYLDKEVLEVRDLAAPNRVARLRIGLGAYQWSPEETHLLLKRAMERKSADLVWIDIPSLAMQTKDAEVPVFQPTPQPIFHGLSFRDFAISPDGRFLGVIAPGRRNLLVFPLPSR